jgi:hypothetical protein
LQKPIISGGAAAAAVLMQIKSAIAMVMMVVRAVVAIITGFFRICIPPAILAIFTCPEGAFFPNNLVQLLEFMDKTDNFLQKIEGYPNFFENSGVQVKNKLNYYLCAQALFTSECSGMWTRCQELSWIFTQPPFTTVKI